MKKWDKKCVKNEKNRKYMGEIFSCAKNCWTNENLLAGYDPPVSSKPSNYIEQHLYTELSQPLAPDSVEMLI